MSSESWPRQCWEGRDGGSSSCRKHRVVYVFARRADLHDSANEVMMRWIVILALALAGCQSVGQRYHQGDRWEMYRLDKNYKPIRVYPREMKENGNG